MRRVEKDFRYQKTSLENEISHLRERVKHLEEEKRIAEPSKKEVKLRAHRRIFRALLRKCQSFEASNRGQFSCRCTLDQWLDLIGVISS